MYNEIITVIININFLKTYISWTFCDIQIHVSGYTDCHFDDCWVKRKIAWM